MNRAHGALLLATVSWGLSFTASDAALEHLTAFDLLLIEVSSGTAVAALVSLLTGRTLRGPWRPAFVLGSLEPGLSYVFANLGLVLTSAAVGAMVFSLESVLVVVIAWLILRHRPRRAETRALVLGVTGTLLVASAQQGGHSSGLGIGFMLMATIAAAAYTLATQRLAAGLEPFALVVRQGAAALVVAAPFVLAAWVIQGTRIGTAPTSSLLLGGLAGVIGFALPFTLWTWAAPRVSPGVAAVALNVTPLFGVLGAVALGRGELTGVQWAGGALILLGVVLLSRAERAADADHDEMVVIPVDSSAEHDQKVMISAA